MVHPGNLGVKTGFGQAGLSTQTASEYNPAPMPAGLPVLASPRMVEGLMDAELKPASPAPPVRYYALDALRAFAMLVTPLLHAAAMSAISRTGANTLTRRMAPSLSRIP